MKDHKTNSDLEKIIPPEIKEDEFYFDLLELARNEIITTVLEIGSSAGSGSTEALVRGLQENPNAPHLYCVEISRSRLNELKKKYANNPFVHCYNVSSVPINKFPNEKEIESFYRSYRTNLNNYPLQKVIGWLQQDIDYVRNTRVPSAGIQIIKHERRIKCFDMVLIDGSEFSGKADLEEVYGSKIVLLDDINSYKNYENYNRLKNDSHYLLYKENWKLRNGYAIFKKITSQHLTYTSVKKMVESVEGYLCPGQEEFLFNKVKSLPDNAVIVEIGSYKGRATVAMGYACLGTNRKIISIDTWDGNDSDFHERDFYNVWKVNIKINNLEKHVLPLRGYSHEILKKWSDLAGGLDIDFILIDGSHQYDDVLDDFILSYPLVKHNGTVAFHDVVHTWPGPERVWNEIAKHVLTDHQYSTSLACGRKKLEKSQSSAIHFFTIVLNGMPFIMHHINVLKQLPFNWHWHIVEGVADLKHDTSWCYQNGGWVEHSVHHLGLSNDGTSEYLDSLAIEHPDRITLYRKSEGAFWDGKLEMVNAPLGRINEPCILWQVDSDELWTAEQIVKVKRMFEKSPGKTAAYFHCHFFVGPDVVTITPNSYSHNNAYEWLRVWRFELGMEWLSHEPPCLAYPQENQWFDTAKINPFRHEETAAEGLVFTHYAYATEAQVRFKETYYGYQNAVSQWRSLQEENRFPVYLRDYFRWVKDNTQIDRVENRTIGRSVKPVEWKLPRIEIPRDHLATEKSPVVIDGVIFQLQSQRPLGISRVWRSLLPNLLKLMDDRPVILLRRGPHSAKIFGLREVEIPLYRLGSDNVLEEDDAMLNRVCRELNCGVFLSTYYTRAPGCQNMLMVHDLIPEAMGFDLHQPEWRSKIRAIDNADSFVAVSDFTRKDLLRFYPQIPPQRVITSHNGVSSDFCPASEKEITSFKSTFQINHPYFLMVGNRDQYKNADVFFRAFTNIEGHKDLQILAVGGEPHLAIEEQRYYGDFNLQVIPWLEDDNMRIAYSGALALIYLSSYEGFGLPLLEALACGCPVITTRSVAIPEVCGESALYLESGRTEDIREAVSLVQDRNVRENLKRTGSARAKTFTWDAAAERVVDVINNIAIESKLVKTVDGPVEAELFIKDKNCLKEFPNRENRKKVVHTNGHQEPIVSAIVSTYNAKKYIKGCLEDLEDQTISDDLEVIVVNSGSEQSEETIVKEFQKKYTNIKYIRTGYRENVYAAWNRAIKAATGRYISNANTDDRHRRDAFEVMVRALDENPEVGAVYANSLITTKKNETFDRNSAKYYFRRPNYNLRQMLIFNLLGPHPMWRRSVHETLGYFDPSFEVAGDYEFFIQLAWQFGALHISENLGLYNQRESSIENSKRQKCVKETIQILKHYRERIPLEEIYPELSSVSDARAARAACLFDQGSSCLFGDVPDIENAIRYFQQAFDLGMDAPELSCNFALALYLDGQRSKGIKLLRQQQQILPQAAANLIILENYREYNGPVDIRRFTIADIKHPVVATARIGHGLKLRSSRLVYTGSNDICMSGQEMIHPISDAEKGGVKEKEHKPAVSVIVRTTNRHDFLIECFKSIANQTFRDLEIVLVNDGGPDVTQVIENYRNRLWIVYKRHLSNRGRTAALNTGLRSAVGKYVTYLDDDDIFYPEHIETLITEMEKGDYAVAYTDSLEARQRQTEIAYEIVQRRLVYSQDFDPDLLLKTNYIPILNVMHRRDCLNSVGLFDESLQVLEDWEFWIRLSRKYSFIHIPKVTAEYRVRDDNSNATTAEGHYFPRCRQRIWDRHRKQGPRNSQKEPAKMTSLVILTCNQLSFTKKCIDSIYKHTSEPFEFIVVDNGSTDGTISYLEALSKKRENKVPIKIIKNKKNLGFAAGNNQGIAASVGDYILLMNNDIVVTPGWLDRLIRCAEKDSAIGIVGPLSNYVSGLQLVKDVSYDTQTLTGLTEFAKRLAAANSGRVQRLLRVVGFCMLIKRAVIEKIGGMDSAYGLGNFEDDDFSLRAALAGFESWMVLDCFVHHFGSRTFIGEQIDYRESLQKNWEIFKQKWELPADLSYDSGYNLSLLGITSFDSSVHYIPHQKAVQIEPANETFQKNLYKVTSLNKQGEDLFGKDNLEGALDVFKKALEIDPSNATTHNNLGVLYYTQGDKEEALKYYQKAAKFDPENITSQKNLADFYYAEMGQVEEAMQIYVKVINSNPEDIETLLVLAHICVALEKSDDAKDFYNRILKIEPGNKDAREFFDKLEKCQLSVAGDQTDQTNNEADSNGYLVSSIVSTYTAERFIRGCLEDLENQTIADKIEIIVVDSGSQQDEEAVIREFQEKYSNIKYLKTDQRETVYAAWNRGIQAATGKYITNANTDDRHRKDALEVMVNILETLPEISLVYADVIITETENETFERCTPVGYFNWLNFNREDLLNKGCFMGPQPMWRKDVHDEYGYFDDSFVTAGDYEFWLRISQSRTFMHLPVQLGLYLRSPGSIEHSNRDKQTEENHKILNMYRKARSCGKIIRRIQVSTSPGHTEPMGENMKSPETIHRNIQADMGIKQPEETIEELEKLAAAFPKFAIAVNDLGVLYYNTGNREKALKFYENAVRLEPGNMLFQKNLADFYCLELGRIEEALKIYVDILTTHPKDIETLLATGQICVALEKPGDARDFFNQVLEIEPWNEPARQHLEALERPSSPAVLVNAESPDEIYQRLKQNLSSLSKAEAIDELEKLLGSYPNLALGHNDLGVLYYHTGEKEKALRHYHQAAHLQPENITLQKNLADLLFVELGKFEEALQIYVGILTTHPDDVETLLITGHICVALKKFDDAKDFYEQVLALEPNNEDANKNLQVLLHRQSRRSSGRPDSLNDVTVSNAKVELSDLNAKESENQDAQPKTAVSIVLSLNGIQNRLKQCIESIAAHTEESHEIILINNGATKGILKWAQNLVKDNAHYQLVKCAKTHSWAQCLNQAVKAAAGEYIVLMHNDVMAADRWLSGMHQCFRVGSGIGVVGPMTNETSGIQKVYFSDDWDQSRLESDAKAFYEQNQYRRVPTTQLASFCLMFRCELTDKIGDFDVQLVSEQAVVVDFCKRSAAWGFQNLVAGDVIVYHADRHKGNRKTTGTAQIPTEDQKRLKENWNKPARDQSLLKGIQMMSMLETVNELNQKGYIDQAVETLLQAIGAVPEEKRLYLALAEISISLRRYQDAIDTLNELPADAKTKMDSEETGNSNESRFEPPSLVASENHEVKTLEILGYAEEGLENFAAAEEYADRMLSIDPKSARALNLKGILAYRKKDLNSAEKFFEKSIASDPGSGEPYSNLATLKLAAGKEKEAMKQFEKSFILSPTDLDIATNYHVFVSESGDYERAEKVVSQAAALYPNNRKIEYMLIDFLVQQGKYDKTMGKIEAAIVKFGIEDGILAAALQVREKLGPLTIKPSKKKTTVSCCMIIKDEEKYLARCLASIKPIVDEMIVVDTGSADRSKDIATAFGAQVYDIEWQKDFAKARNFSLEKASGDWILIMDGDEVISSLDYKHFNQIVKNRPKAPVAYTIVTRNYSALANIVGWVPNDGKYANEEAVAGWIPSVKTRLFYGRDQIWFEGAVHELVDPVVKRKGFETKNCSIPIHHYGRLDKERLERKGELYFEIGKKKMEEMGDDIFAVREMAIQATTLEKNEMAVKLWQRLISLDPPEIMVADAYINMATLYNRLSNFEQALLVANKAVVIAPHIKESHYNYALAELHLGNAQATLKVLEELVNRIPDYPPAQFILSAAYFCLGEKEEGFKTIRKLQATSLGPNLVYPIFELAETLIKAQQNEYALLSLGAAIECDIVNKQILELFNKCIQMIETAKNSPERPRPLPLDRQPNNFENLPQIDSYC